MKNGLTVIVPAYNVEKYLKECVFSLNKQNYLPDQIIIIDDCSTDNTLAIAKELQNKFGNIDVYHNERNLISRCRYEGFKHIKYRYVTFCDSDDFVDEDAYSLLMETVKKTNADIVSFSNKINACVISGTKNILQTHFLEGNVSLCNLLVDASKIDLCSLTPYKEEIDTLTSYKLFSNCKKWAIINGSYYNYRQIANTVSRSRFSIKDFRVINNLNYINYYVEQSFPDLLPYSYNHLLHAKMDLISKYATYGAVSLSDKSRIKHAIKKYKKDLKIHLQHIKSSHYFTKNEKFKTTLILRAYPVFAFISKIRMMWHSLTKNKENIIKI